MLDPTNAVKLYPNSYQQCSLSLYILYSLNEQTWMHSYILLRRNVKCMHKLHYILTTSIPVCPCRVIFFFLEAFICMQFFFFWNRWLRQQRLSSKNNFYFHDLRKILPMASNWCLATILNIKTPLHRDLIKMWRKGERKGERRAEI